MHLTEKSNRSSHRWIPTAALALTLAAGFWTPLQAVSIPSFDAQLGDHPDGGASDSGGMYGVRIDDIVENGTLNNAAHLNGALNGICPAGSPSCTFSVDKNGAFVDMSFNNITGEMALSGKLSLNQNPGLGLWDFEFSVPADPGGTVNPTFGDRATGGAGGDWRDVSWRNQSFANGGSANGVGFGSGSISLGALRIYLFDYTSGSHKPDTLILGDDNNVNWGHRLKDFPSYHTDPSTGLNFKSLWGWLAVSHINDSSTAFRSDTNDILTVVPMPEPSDFTPLISTLLGAMVLAGFVQSRANREARPE